MSSDNIARKAVLSLTIAGYALVTLLTVIAHADSRINVFPNPNVPYRIPLDESVKQQAKYLFGILKEHNYSKLERQLRRYVPELKRIDKEDIEPLDDIVTLAVTATNPEVKEAFDLMIKGGRRGLGYNTELQVLLWLATQNEFKKNDTLAQAIAMVNGLWITLGDKRVRKAVYEDVNDLLEFGRETSEWQGALGLPYNLENYRLEAKVAWAWTGFDSMRHGYGPPIGLIYYKNKKLPFKIYDTLNVSIVTLKEMRNEAQELGWIGAHKDVDYLVAKIEDYLYFPAGVNFNYRRDYRNIVNEEGIMAVLDIDYQFKNYKKGLRFQGDCGTESAATDAWLKSLGISTLSDWMFTRVISRDLEQLSHGFVLYYHPIQETWKAYKKQIYDEMQSALRFMGISEDQEFDLFINRLPVNQRRYLEEKTFKTRIIKGKVYPYVHWEGNMYYQIKNIPYRQIREMFEQGVPTKEMKNWLLMR